MMLPLQAGPQDRLLAAKVHSVTDFPSLFQHGAFSGIARYFNDRTGDRRLPNRSDIDPLLLPRHLLPWLHLVDVEGNGDSYRFRLFGTGMARLFGRDCTGRELDTLRSDFACACDALEQAFDRCVDQGLTTAHRSYLPTRGDRPVELEGLAVPLSDDGLTVSKIFGIIACTGKPPTKSAADLVYR